MARQSQNEQLSFDINAAVVFRLGEELITDVVQAVVELVKNSYDADASWVKVTIDTEASNEWGRTYADTVGVIRIEDDGDGMDDVAIRRGWLTIADSPKRQEKAAGRLTRRGRTPIGDKGLGRLGVQRLASNVEILTRPRQNDAELYVAFSWNDFRDEATLSHVPVVFERLERTQSKPGTTLILSDLRDSAAWRDETYVLQLQRSLSGMISPFEEARDFVVHLEVDGKRLALAEVAQQLRETALLRYRFEFDGSDFRVRGKARLDYLLQPSNRADQQLLRSLCRKDGGEALFAFLAKEAKRRPFSLLAPDSKGWFVEFEGTRRLRALDKVGRVGNAVANPGPFHGEVDSVSLEWSDSRHHVLDRKSDLRRLVRDLAGIRVYRDGFGIRVGEDWLGLGKQWTRGSSYYGLRPANVLGFVAISARDNPDLVETTSREGFQITPHYKNFIGLLDYFVAFSADVQEFLRRGVLKFLNRHRDHSANVEPEADHSEITRRIDDFASTLTAERDRLAGHSTDLRAAAGKAAETLEHVRQQLSPTARSERSIATALSRLEDSIARMAKTAATAEEMIDHISSTLERAAELSALRDVLDRRWNALHDEVTAVYESVSLGLTAEALSHEINNIADGLARRSTALLRSLRKGELRPASVIAYVEHVQSSVAGLRKQLAHLTPSLRYLRERRELIRVVDFARGLTEFYNEKLSSKRIRIVLTCDDTVEFSVKMNRGRLTQVFDNLILNSDYWLREAMRAGEISKGEISIVMEPPVVRVSDNGRGVEPSVEDTIFEPFVTTKRTGEGRGLGLFVVRQLLDSEACGILLLPERNEQGHRYMFEIDLSGALNG